MELGLTQYSSHWTSLGLPYFVNVPESSGPMAPFWLFSIIPKPHNLEATLLALKDLTGVGESDGGTATRCTLAGTHLENLLLAEGQDLIPVF